MKQRILSLILTALMLFALCAPVTAVADEAKEPIELTIESATAATGSKVDIPVTINKNPGVWGFQYDFYYDSQVLRLDSITFGEAFTSDFSFLDNPYMFYPAVVQGTGNGLTEDYTNTGLLATLHFTVFVDAALGDTEIRMEYIPGNCIALDESEIPVNSNIAKVTVTEGITESNDKEDYAPKEPLTTLNQNNNGGSKKEDNGGVKWYWFVLGGVVLLVIIVLVWLFSGSDDSKKAEKPADTSVKDPDENE